MFNSFPKLLVAIANANLGTVAVMTSKAQAFSVAYDLTVNVTKGALAGHL